MEGILRIQLLSVETPAKRYDQSCSSVASGLFESLFPLVCGEALSPSLYSVRITDQLRVTAPRNVESHDRSSRLAYQSFNIFSWSFFFSSAVRLEACV